ncbi:hypothetical protein P3S67_013099 [Capsicum chacoense]
MAEKCRWTLVGKFTMGIPKIEVIRAKFIEQIPLKGKVRIGAYDYRHVFIDFNIEADYNLVYFQHFMTIAGLLMRMFKWPPDFDPNEEISLAPSWVLLPELPLHVFKWDYLKQILEQIGTPMKEDTATFYKTRPHMAEVGVEEDLMKPLPDSVFVGIEGDGSSLKGKDQKLEYEGVSAFYRSSKMKAHDFVRCKVKKRKREQINRDNNINAPSANNGPIHNSSEQVNDKINIDAQKNKNNATAQNANAETKDDGFSPVCNR